MDSRINSKGKVMSLMKDKIQELKERRAELELGGGSAKIEAQHKKGKLTARERILKLLDPDTFVELGLFAYHRCNRLGMDKKKLPADGVVTGYGEIQGQIVYIFPGFYGDGGVCRPGAPEKNGRSGCHGL